MGIFKDEQFEFLDKRTRKILLESREAFVPHTPYAYEKKMLEAIRRGDMGQAVHWTTQVDSGKSGTLSDNPFRQTQIMFTIYIALITRAALDGGVKEDLAYAMSDSYIQTAEKCTTISQINKLKERALRDFVNAVKNQKDSPPYSRAVRKAVTYMRNHLQEKVTVEMLAEVAGLSCSRFSHLFQEETGMSPMAYFRMERLESARSMLVDSELKVYEISTILGFANESHFIKAFREYTGESPGQYRRTCQDCRLSSGYCAERQLKD